MLHKQGVRLVRFCAAVSLTTRAVLDRSRNVRKPWKKEAQKIWLRDPLRSSDLSGSFLRNRERKTWRQNAPSVVDAFGAFGHRRYAWAGWMGWAVAFIITCYYSHVGCWVLRYVVGYVTESRRVYADPLGYFYGMLGYDAAAGATFFPWTAIVFAFVFMAICAFVIIKGVEGGIEKFNKVGMPALFVILLVLLFRAALTSIVSLIEGIVAFLNERRGWRRTPTTLSPAASNSALRRSTACSSAVSCPRRSL